MKRYKRKETYNDKGKIVVDSKGNKFDSLKLNVDMIKIKDKKKFIDYLNDAIKEYMKNKND